MSYGDVLLPPRQISQIGSACFSSNIDPSDYWYDQETLNSISEICYIGSLDIYDIYDDNSEAISYLNAPKGRL